MSTWKMLEISNSYSLHLMNLQSVIIFISESFIVSLMDYKHLDKQYTMQLFTFLIQNFTD